jgi:hypothetical protein
MPILFEWPLIANFGLVLKEMEKGKKLKSFKASMKVLKGQCGSETLDN